ncbi:hypothetical protein CSOJ01_13827 [Colletotrichum sojae]|uniref:Uncharacterized protein n=1 Tax=Colletotrichum sojae TaxID=2175907 RepID=A0A8H6IRZ8_9PEZI|nr:hypothetical protein CSOJ01_13827 [Colletotrichum sojae]
MCQRIYTYFNICGCQLFKALVECKHGPGSPDCGPIHRIAIRTKKGQECRYHARVSYLRQGATSPPTTPISQRTQTSLLSEETQESIIPEGYDGYWDKDTKRMRLQDAFLSAIEEADFDTSDELLETEEDQETEEEDVDMENASNDDDGGGDTEEQMDSPMDVDE